MARCNATRAACDVRPTVSGRAQREADRATNGERLGGERSDERSGALVQFGVGDREIDLRRLPASPTRATAKQRSDHPIAEHVARAHAGPERDGVERQLGGEITRQRRLAPLRRRAMRTSERVPIAHVDRHCQDAVRCATRRAHRRAATPPSVRRPSGHRPHPCAAGSCLSTTSERTRSLDESCRSTFVSRRRGNVTRAPTASSRQRSSEHSCSSRALLIASQLRCQRCCAGTRVNVVRGERCEGQRTAASTRRLAATSAGEAAVTAHRRARSKPNVSVISELQRRQRCALRRRWRQRERAPGERGAQRERGRLGDKDDATARRRRDGTRNGAQRDVNVACRRAQRSINSVGQALSSTRQRNVNRGRGDDRTL